MNPEATVSVLNYQPGLRHAPTWPMYFHKARIASRGVPVDFRRHGASGKIFAKVPGMVAPKFRTHMGRNG